MAESSEPDVRHAGGWSARVVGEGARRASHVTQRARRRAGVICAHNEPIFAERTWSGSLAAAAHRASCRVVSPAFYPKGTRNFRFIYRRLAGGEQLRVDICARLLNIANRCTRSVLDGAHISLA